MKRWDVVRKFTVSRELGIAADSHLTKNQIRRSGLGELACYIQYGIIEAENPDQAAAQARTRMEVLMSRYSVECMVFEMHVTLMTEA